MLFAVVLFFGVACSAFPTSEDGIECLRRCYFPHLFREASPDVGKYVLSVLRRHSLFKRDTSPSDVEDHNMCQAALNFANCSLSCPNSRLDAVSHQRSAILEPVCSSDISTDQDKEFVKNTRDLASKSFQRSMKCVMVDSQNDETICQDMAPCLLGRLDEMKDQYSADVVALVGDEWKLGLAFELKDPASLNRSACSVLFEPYRLEREN